MNINSLTSSFEIVKELMKLGIYTHAYAKKPFFFSIIPFFPKKQQSPSVFERRGYRWSRKGRC